MREAILQISWRGETHFQGVAKRKNAKRFAWVFVQLYGIKVVAIFYLKPKK